MKNALIKTSMLLPTLLLAACGGGSSGGTPAATTTPTTPITTSTTEYLGVAAGGGHTVAIKSDGTLQAWGLNRNGQLGVSANTDKPIPTAIVFPSSVSVSSVSAGEFHTAALSGCTTSGCALWTWGKNDNGRLGDATFTGKTSPTKITGDWLTVSAGGSHTAAIKKKDGSLWTWGENFNGQLGDGTSLARSGPTAHGKLQIADSANPTVYPADSTVTKPFWGVVATGGAHTLAIVTGAATNASGILYRWGLNKRGQLGLTGLGGTPSWQFPLTIKNEPYQFKAVAAGGEHSLAIRDNGELYAFGSNAFGQLGTGTADNDIANNSSVKQVGSESDWDVISAGGGVNPGDTVDESLNGGHSLAIKSDGTLWVWGSNRYGQLGTGNTENISTPTKLGTDRDWVKVSAGKLHSFAWKQDKSLWGWGNNFNGQLGNGNSGDTAKNILVPTRLP